MIDDYLDEISDEQLIRAALDIVEDLPLRHAAEIFGVSHQTVSRWRRGYWDQLNPETRTAIVEALKERGKERLVFSIRPARGEGRNRILRSLRSEEDISSYLQDLGSPGEAIEAKLQALRALEHLLVQFDPLPGWWAELRAEVERE